MRGQVYTTAASLKIAGLAAGAALAGPLAGRSVSACLLVAAGTELCAAAAYLLAGPRRRTPGPRRRAWHAPRKPHAPRLVRDNDLDFCYRGDMQRAQWWPIA
jgi:hypothetical protein